MAHVRPRLSPFSRLLLVQRAQHRPVAHVAAELGVSRQTAYRWVRRFAAQGEAGLLDRPSRPHHSPRRTPAELEAQILALRAASRRGPVWLAGQLGAHPSTIGRVLRRHQVPLLCDLDPVTGAQLRNRQPSPRRYERARPGELLHLDVKKLGRIPPGGGWRLHGRAAGERVRARGIGYDYVHVAVDDHTRLAYAEVLDDERGATCAGFLTRAGAFFAAHGILTIERVLTDNAFAYRHSQAFAAAVAALGASPRFIRPHCPWTNGKAERFIRTLTSEWAYQQPWLSTSQRAAALPGWLQHYNTARPHTALGGHPPMSRLSST
jgi:transposase InsO family protein